MLKTLNRQFSLLRKLSLLQDRFFNPFNISKNNLMTKKLTYTFSSQQQGNQKDPKEKAQENQNISPSGQISQTMNEGLRRSKKIQEKRRALLQIAKQQLQYEKQLSYSEFITEEATNLNKFKFRVINHHRIGTRLEFYKKLQNHMEIKILYTANYRRDDLEQQVIQTDSTESKFNIFSFNQKIFKKGKGKQNTQQSKDTGKNTEEKKGFQKFQHKKEKNQQNNHEQSQKIKSNEKKQKQQASPQKKYQNAPQNDWFQQIQQSIQQAQKQNQRKNFSKQHSFDIEQQTQNLEEFSVFIRGNNHLHMISDELKTMGSTKINELKRKWVKFDVIVNCAQQTLIFKLPKNREINIYKITVIDDIEAYLKDDPEGMNDFTKYQGVQVAKLNPIFTAELYKFLIQKVCLHQQLFRAIYKYSHYCQHQFYKEWLNKIVDFCK